MPNTRRYEESIRFLRINGNGDDVIRDGPAKLFRVVVGGGAAASGTLTIFDNNAASGSVFTIIDAVTAAGTSVEFGQVNLTTGLSTEAAGLVGDAEFTIIYQ